MPTPKADVSRGPERDTGTCLAKQGPSALDASCCQGGSRDVVGAAALGRRSRGHCRPESAGGEAGLGVEVPVGLLLGRGKGLSGLAWAFVSTNSSHVAVITIGSGL